MPQTETAASGANPKAAKKTFSDTSSIPDLQARVNTAIASAGTKTKKPPAWKRLDFCPYCHEAFDFRGMSGDPLRKCRHCDQVEVLAPAKCEQCRYRFGENWSDQQLAGEVIFVCERCSNPHRGGHEIPADDITSPVEAKAVVETETRLLEYHPIADLFPMISVLDLDVLAADIRRNGLREPITLLNGKILDGRNRYEACIKALRDPVFEKYNGDNPLAFVVSKNLHRRHLNESQRAMIAAKLATMKQGTRTDLASIEARSQPEAAELLNVSRSNVQRARKVLNEGTPEMITAVERGELAVSAAAIAIRNEAERKPATPIVASEQTCFLKALERSAKIIPKTILFLKDWDADALAQAQNYIRILDSRLDLIRSFPAEGGAE